MELLESKVWCEARWEGRAVKTKFPHADDRFIALVSVALSTDSARRILVRDGDRPPHKRDREIPSRLGHYRSPVGRYPAPVAQLKTTGSGSRRRESRPECDDGERSDKRLHQPFH